MWTIGTALKFWMKLRGHKPGMVRQLYDLDQAIIGGTATDYHTMRLHALAIFIIELVAMAMTLKDNRFAIGLVGFCTGSEAADPVAQAHGTAFIGHSALRVHQIDDRIGGLRIKFGAVGAFEPQHIAGELDDGHLHSKAEPQVWFFHTTSEVRGLNLSFDAAMAKTARYHDAIESFKDLSGKQYAIANPGDTSHVTAKLLAQKSGIDPDSIEFVAIGGPPDRAKAILMQSRGLAEPEAYALLRTTAMKQGRRIVEVARTGRMGDGKIFVLPARQIERAVEV